MTHTFLVPAMIARLCEEAPEGTTFPALRTVLYGASPISSQTQDAALRLFGPVLHQVYGLSETTGSLTEMVARPDLPADSPLHRSAGRAYPWIEVEIRDPGTGEQLPPNTFGEVWTRSAQNSPGYFGLPEETAALLTPDGWLRTGDGGHLDDDGYLFLTDRVKDMVISGGENVYPAEVEAVLPQHPDGRRRRRIRGARRAVGRGGRRRRRRARTPDCRRRADRVHRGPARRLQAAAHDPVRRRAAAQRRGQGAAPGPAGRRTRGEYGMTEQVRILGFVNHIAPAADIEDEIAQALEWGVDVIVAQGTGSDWGPYWLGSGDQVSANQAANVEPYVRAALEHGIPFVFSFGIAGGNVHLETCLRAFDQLCARNGWRPGSASSAPRSARTTSRPPSPTGRRSSRRPTARGTER